MWTQSRAADRDIRAGHSIAAAFLAHASLPLSAGAAIAGTWSTESRAHVSLTHWSSHRVESLAVSLQQRAKTFPHCADEHIAAIATHTARLRTVKF